NTHHFLLIRKTTQPIVLIQHGFLILVSLEQSTTFMENCHSDLKYIRHRLLKQLKRYKKIQISSYKKWQNGQRKNEEIMQKHMKFCKKCIFMGKILLLPESKVIMDILQDSKIQRPMQEDHSKCLREHHKMVFILTSLLTEEQDHTILNC